MIPVFAPKFGLAGVIAGLFANGEQGAWYDPSDMSTMFQDPAGTKPVTGVEQPVGRILDKSGRGNHATQVTATSCPVLSARVNLLTKTEQFDDAAWVKNGVIVTANQAIAPDGTMTADRAVVNSGSVSNVQLLHDIGSLPTQVNHELSVRVKKAGARYAVVGWLFNASQYCAVSFDFDAEVVSRSAAAGGLTLVNFSTENLWDGWHLIKITARSTLSALDAKYPMVIPRISEWTSGRPDGPDTGDGVSGIYVWGADLRATNMGIGLPAYQRVNTATDYDTAGFPHYLRFDGVDDGLVTPSINFTGTDKMTVFAGVRKLSDASIGFVAELSGDANLNGNGFWIAAPTGSNNSSYGFFSKGTLASYPGQSVSLLFAAPTTNVLVGVGNIAADSQILRVNGAQVASNATDQGTGNYGNHQLFIGRRAGTTAPFNGHLYSLIVRGAQSTAQQIASAEAWVNQRTGAY